jgi:anti-sigma regulatory factor (Ser/Thr protein kinase)
MASPEPAGVIPDPASGQGLDQPFDGDGLYALRAAVAAHGSALGLGEGRIGELVLIANELASNAVRHGGGRGRLRLWRAGGAIWCEVSDSGTGLPEGPRTGLRKAAVGALDGRGLWIVRQLSDEVTVDSDATGTRVRVALRLDGTR